MWYSFLIDKLRLLFKSFLCRRVAMKCYAVAVPFYALLCLCFAVALPSSAKFRRCFARLSFAFALLSVAMPLRLCTPHCHCKTMLNGAFPMQIHSFPSCASPMPFIALPLHGQAWLFLCPAFQSNSYAFLRRSAASCSASASCSRSDLGLTGVDRRTAAAGK